MKFLNNWIQRFASAPLFRVIWREISRILVNKMLLFTSFFGPVFVFLLISWTFSAAVVRDLPVLVVDLDHTSLSRDICRKVSALPAVRLAGKPGSFAEAEKTFKEGKADALLLFPAGMEAAVVRGEQAFPELIVNNSNPIKGGILQSQISAAISGISGTFKVAAMGKKGILPSVAITKAQPVKPDIHLLFNPFGNYASFLMTGLLPLLAVVFILLGSSYAIGIEMKEHTSTAWLQAANQNITIAVLGKLIPYVLLFFADMVAINLLLVYHVGMPLNGSLGIILLSELLLILAYQSMAILILSVTLNLRLTLSLGSAYTMLGLTFSGLTFPAIGMPLLARLFSYLFPYTFWLRIFLSQSQRGEPVHETILPMLAMLPFILCGIAVLPFFKKRIMDVRWRTKE